MKKLCVSVVVMVVFGLGGKAIGAVAFGPTNFDAFGYPDPKCYEPVVPYDRSEYAINAFNSEFLTYKECIRRYLEAATNDRQHILEKHNEIVDQYNRFVRTIR